MPKVTIRASAKSEHAHVSRRPIVAAVCLIPLAVTVFGTGKSQAADIDIGNPDWSVRWDNTLQYSSMYRVRGPSQSVAGSTRNNNLDDGDLNFGKGFVSNRGDLLSELDVSYQRQYGGRVSAAAWYDRAYFGPTNAKTKSTFNDYTRYDRFSKHAKDSNGRNVELRDAFAYGTFDTFADTSLTLRGGQFTSLYGETLFMGANGIAAAQGPVDVNKLLSSPGAQFKEIALPVPQVSAKLQINSRVSVGAYYQFAWQPNRNPPPGSYFSIADIGAQGGDMLFPNGQANGGAYLARVNDINARDSGQGGAMIKFKATDNLDLGVYGAKFHAKDAKIYATSGTVTGTGFGTQVGTFRLVYPEDVYVYGTSFATAIKDTNVSGEFSVRTNQPLVGAEGDVFTDSAGTGVNRLYPVGNTFHGNISAISLFNETALWDGATILGEIGYNRLLDVTNGKPLDRNATHDAWGTRITFEPSYFQVLPRLDITTPISVGWAIAGRSPLGPTVFGPEHGGDVSIGINGEWAKTWKVGLQYTNFFGPKGSLTADPSIRQYSYKQVLADRDYVSFSAKTTF